MRYLDGGLTRRGRSPPLGEARERDRDEQRDAVEERLDEERAAKLLDAGDADREDQHADDGAPHVHASRTDGGRPEERADERGQQVIEADVRLADLELARQDAA